MDRPEEAERQRELSPDDDTDIEVKLVRAECWAYFLSTVPIVFLFVGMALVPQLFHLRVCNCITTAVLLVVMSASVVVLKTEGRSLLLERARLLGNLGHCLRTFLHLLFACFHNDNIFMRLVTLFVLPVSSARQSHSVASYLVYMAAHNLVTIYRFSGDFDEGLPWILCVMIITPVLLDVAAQKQDGKESRLQVESLAMTTTEVSEATKSLLASFCDAVATLGPDLRLLEYSPSLSALLNRRAEADKCILDFLDMSDREEFKSHIQQTKDESESGGQEKRHSMHVRPFTAHLLDVYSGVVHAHMFIAYIPKGIKEFVYVVGIAEAWQPKTNTSSRKNAKTKSFQLNMETGKLEPAFPAFSSGALPLADKIASGSYPKQRTQRAFSPHPAKERQLSSTL